MADPLSEQELEQIRTSLKRCSPETVEAVLRFRQMGDLSGVPIAIRGILQRYLPPENKVDLSRADRNLRLVEDLGIDSLTMLEVVLTIEESLGIRVEDAELRNLRTLGDVDRFLEQKLSGAGAEGKGQRLSREEIALVLPQQPPFLFLDEALVEGERVEARYLLKGDEFFFEGHFKNRPLTPASIVFEAAGQAACLWLLQCGPGRVGRAIGGHELLFLSVEEAHFYRQTAPKALLEIQATLVRLRPPVAVFSAVVSAGGERVARMERLTLAFGESPGLGKDEGNEALGPQATDPSAS
ncbi:phosphopantetheine-binding protein [Candidatus Methylacidithermus pantelleriae]|uniref:3-hydroxyacyl-(Acyl-carrier-protein) dehydratase n=1 Tax=Candidatus Methylacidithermus pantelleriae TaxID=2744239 RepID=A0A8J2BMK6_9BACT|nr:phosphopantetheine-binding protein [Candidatus Methylacidithermus pantelleriae]CAF0689787.1 3-hydroxyacyl-(acyl-carrier-protein) dehydratase [Candidatus Methylacidithermus pantelleriae]